MAQKIVGLDLGTHSVKAVLVSAGLRSVQILGVHEERFEPTEGGMGGDEAIDAAIELAIAALRSKGWHHHSVAVALPGTRGSYRLLRFPFTDARRIGQAVGFEADGQFPVPLERLEYDHIVAPAQGGEGRALVVATRDELVERVSSAFHDANVDVRLVTVAPVAAAQVFTGAAIPEVPEDADEELRRGMPVALVVDIGHRSTEMTAMGPKGPIAVRVHRRGGAHLTRALATSGRLETREAERRKHADAFAPHRALGELSSEQLREAKSIARALEPTIRELEHTRIWLRSEYACEVTVIRLCGGGAHLKGISEYIHEQIGLPVEVATPQLVGGLRKLTASDWSIYSVALGAAVGAAKRPLVQLYVEQGAEETGGWLVEKMPAIAGMALAILAVGALDTIARLSALEAREAAYRAELAEATERVFGEPLASEAEIVERLNEVQGEDLTSLVSARGAVDVLAAVVRAATPEGPRPLPPEEAMPGGPGAMPGAPGVPGLLPGDDPGPYISGPNSSGAPITATSADGRPMIDVTGAVMPPPEERDDEPDAEPASLGADAGVSWEDEIYFKKIEIRERKIEVQVSATRSTAKTRLKNKLAALPCIASITEGRVTDENERKVFDLMIDHECYIKPLEGES